MSGSLTDRAGFWRGAGFALGARGIQVVYGLVSIPVGLWYFGAETYGAWLVISSIVSYVSLANLGVPNAVLTWTAKSDPVQAKSIFRRGLLLTAAISGVLGLGLLSVVLTVPTQEVARIVASTDTEVGQAVLILVLATLLAQPLATAGASLAGQGRVDAQQALQAAHLISNLAALLLAVTFSTSLVGLATLTLIGRVMVGAAGLVWRLLLPFVGSAPHGPGGVEALSTTQFLGSSVRFFLLGLQSTVTHNLDQLVVAHLVSPAAVPAYVAILRLVQGLDLMVTSLLAPARPRFGQLLRAVDDRSGAAELLRATLIASQVAMAAFALGAVLLGPFVLELWLPDPEVAQSAEQVLVPLLVWACVYVSVQTQSTFLFAADRTGLQVLIGFADAAVNLGLSVILARTLGAPGVAGATLLAVLVVQYPGLARLVRTELGSRLAARLTWSQVTGAAWPLMLFVPVLLRAVSAPTWVGNTVLVAAFGCLAFSLRRTLVSSYRTLGGVGRHVSELRTAEP